ncbi:TonB protein [Pseudomonas syringae pv. delphinii]|uniref:Protein TonB n=1 Tax=Pseudomonas syringae pv. delphinii TaxID=192088 RepID=A0A0P9PID9_9PSED|nr:energy transducer TonB [Pseudomonas syringae group genomosp. 3]KPX13188.1 TonB protein [Pseudomonas syringae pv. delphinii]RMP10292.1 TonB protein [Pseudomonas syringae pv. delphinii]RMP27606.1 TonB protein [Pseudomonas syringae pv. delphinii]RMQ29193.1 TonB protein [Pseudomonas syringae pv. delphinii]
MTAMTLMLEDGPPTREWLNGAWLRSNGLAAAVALALHGALLGGLMLGWSAQEKRPEPPRTLTTQLVMLPPAPAPVSAAPVAVAEAVQAPPPAPVVAPPPVVKPLEAPKPQAQPQRQLEQAALARKRVDEQKRERETEQRQRAQNAREAEQQRQQAQAEQQRQAEQARQSAERARQTQVQQQTQQQAQSQAAADSSQYQPLSKEAPDYPERALDKGIEGDCTVVYDVSPQGKVVNPQVQGSCHPLFMRPSLAAAETFRYQPRIVEGRAVMVSGVKNTFHYRIK